VNWNTKVIPRCPKCRAYMVEKPLFVTMEWRCDVCDKSLEQGEEKTEITKTLDDLIADLDKDLDPFTFTVIRFNLTGRPVTDSRSEASDAAVINKQRKENDNE